MYHTLKSLIQLMVNGQLGKIGVNAVWPAVTRVIEKDIGTAQIHFPSMEAISAKEKDKKLGNVTKCHHVLVREYLDFSS